MKPNFTTLVLFLSLLVSTSVLAADIPVKSSKGDPAPAGKPSQSLTPAQEANQLLANKDNKYIQATGPTTTVEGNRIEPQSVTVQPPPAPRCTDYQYVGSNQRPVDNPAGGYRCPAGYRCHRNGILAECRLYDGLDANSVLNASDTRCSWSVCSPI